MAINTSTINSHVYNEILDNILIPSTENWFADNKVILDDNAFSQRTNSFEAFLQDRNIKSMRESLTLSSKSNGKFIVEI